MHSAFLSTPVFPDLAQRPPKSPLDWLFFILLVAGALLILLNLSSTGFGAPDSKGWGKSPDNQHNQHSRRHIQTS